MAEVRSVREALELPADEQVQALLDAGIVKTEFMAEEVLDAMRFGPGNRDYVPEDPPVEEEPTE